MQLTDLLAADKQLTQFIEQLVSTENSALFGANTGALTLFLQAVLNQIKQPLILVASDESKAQNLLGQLTGAITQPVLEFPVDSTIATQGAISSPDERSSRIQSLNFLLTKKPGIVVTTPQGLQYELNPAQEYRGGQKRLKVGREYSLEELKLWLNNCGYQRQALVMRPGEYAVRGDIVDIYPLDLDNPVRLEFFGDEVDSIKYFATSSQRSSDEIKEIKISAAQDRIYDEEGLKKAAAVIEKQMESAPAATKDLQNHFADVISELKKGILPQQAGFLTDFLLKQKASLLSYLAPSGLLLLSDIPLIKQSVSEVDEANTSFINDEIKAGAMLPGQHLRFDWQKIFNADKHHHLYLSLFERSLGRVRLGQKLNWQTRECEQFFSQMPLIKTQLESYAKAGNTVVVQADSTKRARQIDQNLADYGIDLPIVGADEILQQKSQIIYGDIASGFILPEIKLVYLTERELFNKRPARKHRVHNLENAQRLRNYTELKPGDYVVHVNHGIGRFEGIKTLENDGQKRDYITITYQKGDQLFVPADQLGLVQKYVASEGKTPHINKLGGSEWAKTKRKVQSKVEDIADDLIELYAKRESEKGFAFSPDDDLQKKFEDAFPYVETPDQLRSAEEIKKDMEKTRPMDRLLVGDVGFGKTEVALRAAFKAIENNKQVAFLVPTTILAQQHYDTILDRFHDFPVKTAMLSRFQSAGEAKKIISGLEEGKIDIVVGTHRILSQDVHFKDLGLLIVDEEQRFGVKHKEKLKQLKANIDVLTLTATPIPRTLHMSMVGVRDLSVMETPPQNRYPIQTYVMEEIPSVIKEAIRRELKRNGQVFYLHNRIGDIEEVTQKLEQLLPEARIGYVHGRMSENQLEDMLYRFLHGEFDVLVTTTIIETGIDMPNVNTMIVENADRYGLSQLYQLRGRIGRSARLAYAYFLYQPNKVLTEVGEKRLDAIRDFTELGSGFKIAMRDLSIRGAGNMLGKQQHGFIDSVGYDLYSQMLSDAIAQKKGKKHAARSNSDVELGVEAYIPNDYIADQEEKIEFYKRIKQTQTTDKLNDIEDELIDRFGDYPSAVEDLLAIAKIKILADLAQVKSINKIKDKVRVVFLPAASRELEGPNIFRALEHVSLKAKINLDKTKQLTVLLLLDNTKNRVLFNELETFLKAAEKIIDR